MSTALHTPGPWVARFEEAYYVTGPDGGRVAMMMNLKGAHGLAGRRSGDESAANCRLIAATPDLLDAGEQVLAAWNDLIAAMQRTSNVAEAAADIEYHQMHALRRAIAKATGSAT